MLQLKKKTSIIVMTLITSAAIVSVFITFEQPRATLAQTSDEDLCGKTVTLSITLTSDLKCDGDGIRVQGNGIIINLNGFAMTGSGDDTNTTAIFVDGGRRVTIHGPGMIESFGTGIRYSNAAGGTVSNIQIGNNHVGLIASSSEETQWKQLYLHDNAVGILDDGSQNSKVQAVMMSSNDVGVHVLSNSKGMNIDFNLIMDGQTGVQVDPGVTSTDVFYNTMFRQAGLDMKLPTPLEGVLLGNNECTLSDPAQYCQGRVLPSGQRITTNECGAGRALDESCAQARGLLNNGTNAGTPAGGAGEKGMERGLGGEGAQETLSPEAQQAANAAMQSIMNGAQQTSTQSSVTSNTNNGSSSRIGNQSSSSSDSESSDSSNDNNNIDSSRSGDNNG